jgi:hypothetical protein
MMSLYPKELDPTTMLNHNFMDFQQEISVRNVKPNATIFCINKLSLCQDRKILAPKVDNEEFCSCVCFVKDFGRFWE